MKNSSDSSFSFHFKKHQQFEFPLPPHKKPRLNTVKRAVLHIQTLGIPLISRSTGHPSHSIGLEPYRPVTIGRKPKLCEFVFSDHRVSKRHCQLLFDSLRSKIYFSDGLFPEFGEHIDCFTSLSSTRVSLNGAFVNGVKIEGVVELCVGDVVSLNCGVGEACDSQARVQFLLGKIVFTEEVDNRGLSRCGRGYCLEKSSDCLEFRRNVDSTSVLLSWCRDILCNDDPVSYIQKRIVVDQNDTIDFSSRFDCTKGSGLPPSNPSRLCSDDSLQIEYHNRKRVYSREVEAVEKCDVEPLKEVVVVSEENNVPKGSIVVAALDTEKQEQRDDDCVDSECGVRDGGISAGVLLGEPGIGQYREEFGDENTGSSVTPPGKKFFLNQLQRIGQDMNGSVSLPELFHPIESLERVFIATFTSDILWFVSYCKIPPHLPVTIACHSAERCWNSHPDKRSCVPFSGFPNLTVVYPLFPGDIAFNKDQKNSGIGCHHPKLFVLQREDSLRVVVTSANLVARQWHNVTNTVWWQDFPRLSKPDCSALFTRLSVEDSSLKSKGDFVAQLAGFMSSLVADVPSQAHWMLELIKYDFGGAVGYLVASVPGIHSYRSMCVSKLKNHLMSNRDKLESCDLKLLASVEASVVGMSHIYRTSSDSHGTQLKKLALFLRKCEEDTDGRSEVVLRRDTNIPVDRNAVSVLVPNPEVFSAEDFVQLGFLPRDVAKWVAPLSDSGLFAFSAFIYPKEVLATASEGSSNKVKLILHVYEGPSFSNVSEAIQVEYAPALCSLVASSQRHAGLWRLKEVLGQYKWPEHLESEFFFGSSSVGSVNAHFLAAFSAAAGKKSAPFSDSEESDPEWGCWSASQELRNPSLNIIFPSIERVKSNIGGVMVSRRLLCFSQKTWQRLKNVRILHDAVPYPTDRVGFPMHVKVGRRRFKPCKGGSSFGWVYSGSHNFSAAAWGLPLSDKQSNNTMGNDPALGSRLRISNYELGIIFVVPPPNSKSVQQNSGNLDDIVMPFVVPPPKYGPCDRPATAQAMREAFAELREMEISNAGLVNGSESMIEEVPEEEEEVLETGQFIVAQEKEDDKAYADQLWSQVDSS